MAVLLGKNVDILAAKNILMPESRQPFCRSNIGMAVLKGAHKPDISTVDAFNARCSTANRWRIRCMAPAARISRC